MGTHGKTLVFVIGVMVGILCGEVSVFGSDIAVFAVVLALTQGGVYFLERGSERKRKQGSDAVGVAPLFSFSLITILFCLGVFIGVVRIQLVEEKIKYVCEAACTFEAEIVSSPEAKNEYQVFQVHSLSESDGTYDIQIRSTLYPKYHIGDTLLLSGKVTVPDSIMPHSMTKNNNGFDYPMYLQTHKIGSQMFYPSILVIDFDAHSTTAMLGRLKEFLVTKIDTYVTSPASSLASGMLFGVTSMSDDLLQAFRTAGLSHIIVLSGFNIVIVITSILFVLQFLPLFLRIAFASLSVIVFVVMVGGSTSVVRATLMAFIALLATALGRAYVARQALILSLFLIIMYEPYSLKYDTSLHLSFLATMGLVYMSDSFSFVVSKYFGWVSSASLRELLTTTFSAYVATLPYCMYAFGSVSVYALLANIIVVPFVPVAMLLSFLVVVASSFSETLSLLLGFIDTTLLDVLIGVVRVIESLPFATFVISISLSVLFLLYVLVGIFLRYIFVSFKNETQITPKGDILMDIISY
jgi:competence protein ComEC